MPNASELVDQIYAAFNSRNWNMYPELCAKGYVGWASGDETMRGAAAQVQWDKAFADAFPDSRITTLRKATEGSLVISENRFTGTHTAPMQSAQGAIPPTGKHLDLPYVGVWEIEGNKISAQRIYYDRAELLAQLGLAPSEGT